MILAAIPEYWWPYLYQYGVGAVIFTIGMMVPDHTVPILENCASSPSHFYHVADLDVASAFESIARSLTNLQLVH